MKGIQKITLFLLGLIVLVGCSRKKSTFMTRNYHAVTAEYNALYNGGLALEAGNQSLAQTYKDNFWEILPVERFEQTDRITKPGESKDANFERAEEKAAKAIQKHSIYIDGKEHNPQIDEAYIMLGKARYYDQRFIPALDAFNFVLNRYPTSNSINRAKMWKAKSNIRLRNEEIALRDLGGLLNAVDNGNIKMKDEEYADANAIMAQAWINLDSLEAALPFIVLATEHVKNSELKGRYNFIKGQIFDRLELKDSANLAYQQVIDLNRRSPRAYMINAYIAQAKNFDYEGGDRTAFLELLVDLQENRENRPFLDKIYNQFGEYYRNIDQIDTAVTYYNKSIKAYNDDALLQSVNYSTLAEINFDAAEYKAAGDYYDSTLTFLEERSKPWRLYKKKRDNLTDVIKYEDIAVVNDSILRIANMTEEEQLAFFTAYTDKLKEAAISDSIAKVQEKEKEIANNEFFKKSKQVLGDKKGGKFYFYNSTAVAYGKEEFRRIWGDRDLEDAWRLSGKTPTVSGSKSATGAISDAVPISENKFFNPETYLSQIPKDPEVIDSISKERDLAYYQLGLIYKEKFREPRLAANRFEKLLSYDPIDRLILPSKYHLYQIYHTMDRPQLAEGYKDQIIAEYPDSRYAEILRNPDAALALDESSPEYKYEKLYEEFEAHRYTEVIEQCDTYITAYFGDAIVSKFELLKATALARRDGFEAYKEALNYVSLTYPNREEGKQAKEISTTILPGLASKEFTPEREEDKWKIIYVFKASETEAAEELKAKIDDAIFVYNYRKMSASIDYFDPDTRFVVLHGIESKLGARNLGDALSENKKYKIRKAFFEISSSNYKTIQIHKNLEEYLASDPTLEENYNPQK